MLKPGDFDWAGIHKDGVRWFHSGGIFAALSETTGELILEGIQAAKANTERLSRSTWNYRAAAGRGRRPVAGPFGAGENRQQRRRPDRQRGGSAKRPRRSRGRTWGRRRSSILEICSSADRQRRQEVPEHQDGGYDVRSAFDQSSRLGRGAVAGGSGCRSDATHLDVIDRIGGGDGFALYHRPRAGRRRGVAGRGAAARLGSRGAADDVPRRRVDGEARRGRGAGPRRIRTGSALGRISLTQPIRERSYLGSHDNTFEPVCRNARFAEMQLRELPQATAAVVSASSPRFAARRIKISGSPHPTRTPGRRFSRLFTTYPSRRFRLGLRSIIAAGDRLNLRSLVNDAISYRATPPTCRFPEQLDEHASSTDLLETLDGCMCRAAPFGGHCHGPCRDRERRTSARGRVS